MDNVPQISKTILFEDNSAPNYNSFHYQGDKEVVNASIALIMNEFNQIFVSQRLMGFDFENSLEFPGGKIEENESPEQALIRELEEEIDIMVLNQQYIGYTVYETEEKVYYLRIFRVKDYVGTPYGKEGQEIFWMHLDDLDTKRFPPANTDFITILQTNPRYREQILE